MAQRNMLARKPEQAESRPKALLLGVSYPCIRSQMIEHDFDPDVLEIKEPGVEQAVECVRRGILTEMDARDYARCVATEQATNLDVYTVSKEIGAQYRADRHIYANFNARTFCQSLKDAFGADVQFNQVILDYYWMPTGWLVTRWAKTLFQQTLPDLVRNQMLVFPSTRSRSRRNGRDDAPVHDYKDKDGLEVGVVYLPFCAHCCKELVGAMHILEKYYEVTFITKDELPEHSLWRGTMAIDSHIMQTRFGKRLDQEEVYCTFRPKDIFESMEDSHVKKPDVMNVLMAIENYDDIRMIRLRPLPQHEPPNLFRQAYYKENEKKGGFVDLDLSPKMIKERQRKQKEEQKLRRQREKKLRRVSLEPSVVYYDDDDDENGEPSRNRISKVTGLSGPGSQYRYEDSVGATDEQRNRRRNRPSSRSHLARSQPVFSDVEYNDALKGSFDDEDFENDNYYRVRVSDDEDDEFRIDYHGHRRSESRFRNEFDGSFPNPPKVTFFFPGPVENVLMYSRIEDGEIHEMQREERETNRKRKHEVIEIDVNELPENKVIHASITPVGRRRATRTSKTAGGEQLLSLDYYRGGNTTITIDKNKTGGENSKQHYALLDKEKTKKKCGSAAVYMSRNHRRGKDFERDFFTGIYLKPKFRESEVEAIGEAIEEGIKNKKPKPEPTDTSLLAALMLYEIQHQRVESVHPAPPRNSTRIARLGSAYLPLDKNEVIRMHEARSERVRSLGEDNTMSRIDCQRRPTTDFRNVLRTLCFDGWMHHLPRNSYKQIREIVEEIKESTATEPTQHSEQAGQIDEGSHIESDSAIDEFVRDHLRVPSSKDLEQDELSLSMSKYAGASAAVPLPTSGCISRLDTINHILRWLASGMDDQDDPGGVFKRARELGSNENEEVFKKAHDTDRDENEDDMLPAQFKVIESIINNWRVEENDEWKQFVGALCDRDVTSSSSYRNRDAFRDSGNPVTSFERIFDISRHYDVLIGHQNALLLHRALDCLDKRNDPEGLRRTTYSALPGDINDDLDVVKSRGSDLSEGCEIDNEGEIDKANSIKAALSEQISDWIVCSEDENERKDPTGWFRAIQESSQQVERFRSSISVAPEIYGRRLAEWMYDLASFGFFDLKDFVPEEMSDSVPGSTNISLVDLPLVASGKRLFNEDNADSLCATAQVTPLTHDDGEKTAGGAPLEQKKSCGSETLPKSSIVKAEDEVPLKNTNFSQSDVIDLVSDEETDPPCVSPTPPNSVHEGDIPSVSGVILLKPNVRLEWRPVPAVLPPKPKSPEKGNSSPRRKTCIGSLSR